MPHSALCCSVRFFAVLCEGLFFLVVSVAPAPRELSLLGKFSGRNVNLFTELQLKFRDDLK